MILEIYAVVNLEGNSGRFTYYGFTNAIEREFFEALLTVASIGPRFRRAGIFVADVDDRRGDRSRRSRPAEVASRYRAAKGARHRRKAAGEGREVPTDSRCSGSRRRPPSRISRTKRSRFSFSSGTSVAEGEAMIRQTLEREPQLDQAEQALGGDIPIQVGEADSMSEPKARKRLLGPADVAPEPALERVGRSNGHAGRRGIWCEPAAALVRRVRRARTRRRESADRDRRREAAQRTVGARALLRAARPWARRRWPG